jgi:hypothetical protein
MLYYHVSSWISFLLIWKMGGAGVAATGPGMADESKEADLASALQRIVVSAKDIGLSEGTRTVTIKYCSLTCWFLFSL